MAPPKRKPGPKASPDAERGSSRAKKTPPTGAASGKTGRHRGLTYVGHGLAIMRCAHRPIDGLPRGLASLEFAGWMPGTNPDPRWKTVLTGAWPTQPLSQSGAQWVGTYLFFV